MFIFNRSSRCTIHTLWLCHRPLGNYEILFDFPIADDMQTHEKSVCSSEHLLADSCNLRDPSVRRRQKGNQPECPRLVGKFVPGSNYPSFIIRITRLSH
jgi:hypothetical protein